MSIRFLRISFFILLSGIAYSADKPLIANKNEDIAKLSISRILEMTIDATINPATFSYLTSGYQKANAEDFDAILIKLNTPGGLVTTTKQILSLMGSSTLPTIIWVSPEGASATSAGAIIASGAHILLMADGTNIGAATPIQMGKDIDQKDSRNKAINDLVALIESLAETRGRNREMFAQMIRDAASFSAQESKNNNLIDGIVNTKKDLIDFLDNSPVYIQGKNYIISTNSPEIKVHEMDLGQQLLNVFANPSLAYILFIIGALLLYVELQTAGGLIAGSVGIVFLIFAAIGFQVLPLNFGALGLIVLAFVLFVLEAFITSYGLLSFAALTSLVSGSLFLFRTDDAYLAISKALILSVSIAIALFMIFIVMFWVRDNRKNKNLNDQFAMLGLDGVVISCLPNHGEEGLYFYQIRVAGEIWQACSETQFQIGDNCQILSEYKKGLIVKI